MRKFSKLSLLLVALVATFVLVSAVITLLVYGMAVAMSYALGGHADWLAGAGEIAVIPYVLSAIICFATLGSKASELWETTSSKLDKY